MTDERFRILLVEDNAADVYLFQKALKRSGLNVDITVIEDGGEALRFVRGEGDYAASPLPDLAVLDLNLPRTDGISLLEAIRRNQRLARLPVLVASSSSSIRDLMRTEHLRMERYFVKPPDLDDFLEIGTVLKEMLLEGRQAGF